MLPLQGVSTGDAVFHHSAQHSILTPLPQQKTQGGKKETSALHLFSTLLIFLFTSGIRLNDLRISTWQKYIWCTFVISNKEPFIHLISFKTNFKEYNLETNPSTIQECNDTHALKVYSLIIEHIFEFLPPYECTHVPEGESVGENMVIIMSEFTSLNSYLCCWELGFANYPSL